MRLDIDVEKRLNRKFKHSRKMSDPTLSLRLPPWYVRVFLYSMMVFCFCMVLFWSPSSGPSNKHEESSQHEKTLDLYKKFVKDVPEERPIPKEKARLVNFKELTDLKEEAGKKIETKCEVKKAETVEFTVCTDSTISDAPVIERKLDESIAKLLISAFNKYPAAGFLDIGPATGTYTMLALASGKKVFAAELFPSNLQLLKMAAEKNGHLDQLTLINNAISDNVGDFALDDPIRHRKPTAVRTIRFEDILAIVPFHETIIRVTVLYGVKMLLASECSAIASSKELFQHLQVHEIIVQWGTGYRITPVCITNLKNHLEAHKFLPFSVSGSSLNLDSAATEGWNGDPIVFRKE